MNNIDAFFNVCKIGNYIKQIYGLPSNSASPSDILFVIYKTPQKNKYVALMRL